jgi:hypothetical protein
MSTGWRGCKDTDRGPIVGGVKGQHGGGGVEDGEGVDLDLDVAGARLGRVSGERRLEGVLTWRRSFSGRSDTRPLINTDDSTGTCDRDSAVLCLFRRTTSCVVPEASLMGKNESTLEIFLDLGRSLGGAWGGDKPNTAREGAIRRGRRGCPRVLR